YFGHGHVAYHFDGQNSVLCLVAAIPGRLPASDAVEPGLNGHGKSTLFRALSGLLPVWSGSIAFQDADIANKSPATIVELGLIHVPQGNTLFPDLTVLENLWLGAFPKRAQAERRRTIEQVFALFPRLAERRGQRCRT